MTDTELIAFQQVFTRLGGVFGKKAEDLTTLSPSYFRALSRYPYADVARAADVLTAGEQHFPRPARWIEAIRDLPRGNEVLAMPADEMSAWLAAERQGFEGRACGCVACLSAGVSDKPLRFVPVEPHDRRRLDRRLVLRGEWIHGWDLARWYQARGDCYEVMMRLKLGHPLRDLMESL